MPEIKKTKDKYTNLGAQEFQSLKDNYLVFLENLDDVTKEPVRVFKPLPPKALEELQLIRSVSEDLQKKKDDDMKKAAQAAHEEAEKAKEAAKQAAEEAKAAEGAQPEEGEKKE